MYISIKLEHPSLYGGGCFNYIFFLKLEGNEKLIYIKFST